MPVPRLRVRLPTWLRTARLRLTALYGGFFLLCGAVLVAITYGLFERATQYKPPRLPTVPHTPTIHELQHLPSLAQALPRLLYVQRQLAHALSPLAQARAQFQHPSAPAPRSFTLPRLYLAQAQQQLTQAQHRLAQAQQQLTQAVHEVAQAGNIQAAQRAADSHQLLVNSGIALAIVALLAVMAGWLVAGRILRPVRTITRTARRISSTSLHERLAIAGPADELKELGDTLDDLFGRLDAAFAAQRHFVANASHELRTPLAADRTVLQVALDDPHTSAKEWRSTAEELLGSSDEQQRLLEALLTLAASEGGLDRRERTDLADICQAVLPRSGDDVELLGLQIETAIRSAPLEGDARLIERLVANLVDNAIGHNVASGHVQISSGTRGSQAVLSVINSGPVVPPSEIDRLFEPFQRLDPRRTHSNGHGLGLSIVRAIADAHGATVTAEPQTEGGLKVEVVFPVSNEEPKK